MIGNTLQIGHTLSISSSSLRARRPLLRIILAEQVRVDLDLAPRGAVLE